MWGMYAKALCFESRIDKALAVLIYAVLNLRIAAITLYNAIRCIYENDPPGLKQDLSKLGRKDQIDIYRASNMQTRVSSFGLFEVPALRSASCLLTFDELQPTFNDNEVYPVYRP